MRGKGRSPQSSSGLRPRGMHSGPSASPSSVTLRVPPSPVRGKAPTLALTYLHSSLDSRSDKPSPLAGEGGWPQARRMRGKGGRMQFSRQISPPPPKKGPQLHSIKPRSFSFTGNTPRRSQTAAGACCPECSSPQTHPGARSAPSCRIPGRPERKSPRWPPASRWD